MQYQDAAKYVTETGQPSIFIIVEISKKWYDSLPADLQQIVDKQGQAQALAINPIAAEHRKNAEAEWNAGGGELINLPPDEHATMMKTLSTVGADVSKSKPQLAAAYKVVTDAAAHVRQAANQ